MLMRMRRVMMRRASCMVAPFCGTRMTRVIRMNAGFFLGFIRVDPLDPRHLRLALADVGRNSTLLPTSHSTVTAARQRLSSTMGRAGNGGWVVRGLGKVRNDSMVAIHWVERSVTMPTSSVENAVVSWDAAPVGMAWMAKGGGGAR